jgi:hypothetical protein
VLAAGQQLEGEGDGDGGVEEDRLRADRQAEARGDPGQGGLRKSGSRFSARNPL